MRTPTLAALSFALSFAIAPVALAGGSGIVITPTIDRPGETSDKSPPHGTSKYKIRDADGNVVAEGSVAGAGPGENTPQPVSVDLPPGEYTVEMTYDDGATHAEGTSQYGGSTEVTVGEGAHPFTEVEVEPLTPEEYLDNQIQDAEDGVAAAEESLEELEEDIAGHVMEGEDVGQEHLDMLKERRKKLKKHKRLLALLEASKRAKKLQLLGNVGGGAAKAAGRAPNIPHMPPSVGKGPPKGRY